LLDTPIPDFYVGRAPVIAAAGEIQEFGDQIKERCAGRKPRLIILDTVAKCMVGMDENNAKDAGQFVQFCDSLVEAFDCAVLALIHMGKDGKRGPRGSSAFVAGFDTILEVEGDRKAKRVNVIVKQHKDAEERETPWAFQGRVTGPSLTFDLCEMADIGTEEVKDDPLNRNAVGQALVNLGARGVENAVTTSILAGELVGATATESAESIAERANKIARQLSIRSKTVLAAYKSGFGHATKWYIPD
jgi:hypothetical protein